MYDVLIFGGGVTGAAIARELCRYQLKAACLEREPDIAMGATKANSAIVHGGYAEPHEKLKGRLCYEGRRQFARLDSELHFGFAPIGSLVLAFEEEQRRGLEALLENGRKNGLPDLELLEGQQARNLEPNVNPKVKYALYCKGAGVASSFGFAIALMENAVANGLHLFLNSKVTAIQKTQEGFSVTTREGKTFAARYLVNAAGIFAADVAKLAGLEEFSIQPRSGEYILLSRDTGVLLNQVLFQMPTKMGKGILVTPTIYGNLMMGPDAIDEACADRDTHVERLHAIYKTALKTTSKIEITKFLRSFAGVRAVANTDDFIIGQSQEPHFIHAAGIQSPGITSAPAVATHVRDALANAGLHLREKPNFDPQRKAFPAPVSPPLTGQQIKPLLELEEGEGGRMVCRCQQVSESAMREVLGRNLPIHTVDAMKRRTLAGMGWCQGDFCRPRTASLLTRHSGMQVSPESDVQRDGLHRVGREELMAYLQSRKNNQT